MVFAPFSKKVIGIELISQSVQSAKENISLNNISNFEMFEGDVGKTLTKLLSDTNFSRPDLVIVDPPRAGLDPLAISHLKAIKAKSVIYVSCNPKTQAENIKELLTIGYKLKILQPVDQFPHTIHIENIALLEMS
jgi:23S rRNA (uracil1939-C5)-methyltransferase